VVFAKIKWNKATKTDGVAIEAYKASPEAQQCLFDLVFKHKLPQEDKPWSLPPHGSSPIDTL
jgi:hypothetical protein